MSLKHEEAEGQEFLRIMLRYDERNAVTISSECKVRQVFFKGWDVSDEPYQTCHHL